VFTRGFIALKYTVTVKKPVKNFPSVFPMENAFRNGIGILTKYFFSLMKS